MNTFLRISTVAAMVLTVMIGFYFTAGCSHVNGNKPEQVYVHASEAKQLEDIQWYMTEVSGTAILPQHEERRPIIKFDGIQKQSSGFNGCNNFFGSYELNGASLKFGPVAATRRFCEGTAGEVEMKFMQVLEKTSSWEIKDSQLVFLDNTNVLARFSDVDVDVVKEDMTEIVGTGWKWEQTIYGNDKKTVPADPDKYTLTVSLDGTVDVRADCNRGGGTYTREGSSITINITHTTMAMCPPDSLEEEFLRNLAAAAIYFVKDDNLYLDLKFDTGTMKFSKLL